MKAVRYFALRVLFVLTAVLFGVVSVGYGRVIYVDDDANGLNDGSSWVNAYKYLQDALVDANSAGKPVEIRVAQGIYKPDRSFVQPNGTGDRTSSFQLLNGVTLKGGYAGFGASDPNARDIALYKTILSGDLAGNDVVVSDPCDLLNEPTRGENSYHVVIASGTNPDANLDGFTVIAGNDDQGSESSDPRDKGHGGGMYIDSGKPTLVDCIFTSNSARHTGGGIYTAYSAPRLVGCKFVCNSALLGGGMFNIYSRVTLTDCMFFCNTAAVGAGLCDSGLGFTGIGCTFAKNDASADGGGLDCQSGTLTNCIFIANSASRQDYFFGAARPAQRGRGSAISCGGPGSLTVSQCTFSGNISVGPVVFNVRNSLTISGCIFWDGGLEIGNGSGAVTSITYSVIQGGWAGVDDSWGSMVWGQGNIDADPCFADPGYWADPNDPNSLIDPNDPNAIWIDGDYHLKSQAGRWEPKSQSWIKDDVTSLCIDAGDPNSPIGYEIFPNGGRVNMGAYGGTDEASKSYFGKPPCETINVGDINGDCKVNFTDLALIAAHWLEGYTTTSGPDEEDGGTELKDLLATIEGESEEQPYISLMADIYIPTALYIRSISAPQGIYFAVDPAKRGSPQEAAEWFLTRWRNLFVNESLAVGFNYINTSTSGSTSYVLYQQTYAGLEVHKAQMTIQVNPAGGVVAVSSDVMRDTKILDTGQVSLEPSISSSEAQTKAIEFLASAYHYSQSKLEAGPCTLMILSPGVVGFTGQPQYTGKTQLVWQTWVVGKGGYRYPNEHVLVNAHNGDIAMVYSLIHR